jgi:hypothetical protein
MTKVCSKHKKCLVVAGALLVLSAIAFSNPEYIESVAQAFAIIIGLM